MARPFLSVLIDTYNHEQFIEEAVTSVLAQDFPAADREVLVVDDGSTDRTAEILAKFASQIRILRKPNGGQASAFNHGIPQCRGEIVAFLDGDDWWTSDKLTHVVQAMTANPAVGLVGHGVINVLRDGSQRAETLLESFCFQANSLVGARLFRRRGAFLGTSRMTIRADLLRRIGPVPEEIQIQADEYLFTLASVLMPAQILPDALTFYRLHAGNSFQLDSYDEQKMRHKQKSLAALVKTLLHRMEELGTDARVSREVVAYTQACADQLRLTLDGGWPWETARTEWQLYRIAHPDAKLPHQIFKSLTLFGSLFVPPRIFYRVKNALARSGRYQRVRERWLRVPEMKHIQNNWRKHL
jgi:cellulose synthase/poly-beta-1,6-N-acetylglucosamine synthase-like glycosyltransferase